MWIPNRVAATSTIARRVWIISTQDEGTAFATFWHSFSATANSLQPFGSCDATIRPEIGKWNIVEAKKLMDQRGLLAPGTRIGFLEIAGHGLAVKGLIPLEHIDPTSATFNSPDAQATRDVINLIRSKLTADAEIKLAGCDLGRPDQQKYMLTLAAVFRRKVSANTGTVAITGAGTWMFTDADGKTVNVDDRWGSWTYPARLYDHYFVNGRQKP